jgi:MFS family permease
MSLHATPRTPPPISSHPCLPQKAPPRWKLDTFRALRHRNYRLYFWGQFVSVTGSWAQSAALTWLAYELTHGSIWPSLVGAMQVLPTFVLGAWGGSLADRWPKRGLIFLSQATLLLLAVLLGGLVLVGQVTPWHLLAIATAAGLVNALDLPARLAFVIDLVGRDDLTNAIALNSLLFNTARVVGPALSAVVFAQLSDGRTGQTAAGVCFLINGLSFVAVLAALAWMDLPPAHREEGRIREGGSLWAGFRYLGQHPRLILLLVLSAMMSLFGWPILSLLPAVSDQCLKESTSGYAWMLSAIGGGAGFASLLVASFQTTRRARWFLVAGVILASASLLGLALARSLPLAVACCAFLGCGLILFFPTSQSIMQLSSADHVRGRVMGIWSMALSAAFPLGHLLAGHAADCWFRDGSINELLASWLSVGTGESSGLPLVLALMGLGIAAASALVFLLASFHSLASKPKLRR